MSLFKMRFFLYMSGLCLLANVYVLYSISNQETVLQGHQYYEKKEFTQALDAYKKVSNKGCAIWYNMGNCAYQLEQFDNAWLYWLRAYKRANKKQVYSIKKNIQILEDKLGTTLDLSSFDSALCDTPLFLLQILLIILWVIFLWASVSWFRKKKYIFLLVFGLITSIVAAGVVLKNRIMCRNYAVVQDDVSLFAGPNDHYHTVSPLKRSLVVVVCGNTNGWCKIKYGSLVGWVPAEKLAQI